MRSFEFSEKNKLKVRKGLESYWYLPKYW